MIEEAKREIHDRTLPWDEIRERRVLARVEDELARPSRRGHRWLAMTAVAAGFTGLVLATLAWLNSRPTEPPSVAPIAVLEDGDSWQAWRDSARSLPEMSERPSGLTPVSRDGATMLALSDGSIVKLEHGAQLDIGEQGPSRIVLHQRSGEVRYEVAPNRERDFEVTAGPATIRVIGTAFTVVVETVASTKSATAQPVAIRVFVDHGHVDVHSDGRKHELLAGEALRLVDDGVPNPLAGPRPAKAGIRTAPRSTLGIEELERLADEARRRHDWSAAADALSRLVDEHANDPRTYSALFTLAKVERSRGRHVAAAEAFSQCWKKRPHGPLSEDARAEEAVSWDASGNSTRADEAARGYLDRHPTGTHRERMQRLLAK